MNKLLTTSALIVALSFTGMAHAEPGHGGKGDSPYMNEALTRLPTDKAEAFRSTMKASREKSKPQFEQSKKIRDDIRTILTADKFDKKAYLAKSAEQQKVDAQIRTDMNQAFADSVEKLSATERKALADGMHEKRGKRHNRERLKEKPADATEE